MFVCHTEYFIYLPCFSSVSSFHLNTTDILYSLSSAEISHFFLCISIFHLHHFFRSSTASPPPQHYPLTNYRLGCHRYPLIASIRTPAIEGHCRNSTSASTSTSTSTSVGTETATKASQPLGRKLTNSYLHLFSPSSLRISLSASSTSSDNNPPQY